MNINKKIDNILYVIGAIKFDVARLEKGRVTLLRRGRKGFTSISSKILPAFEKEILKQKRRALKLKHEVVALYTFQLNELKGNA